MVEALYHGAAIVTTSIGAAGFSGAGEVMAVEDEPETFARVLVRLYSRPEECRRLSEKTQDYVKTRYSVEAAWSVVKEDFAVEQE